MVVYSPRFVAVAVALASLATIGAGLKIMLPWVVSNRQQRKKRVSGGTKIDLILELLSNDCVADHLLISSPAT